MNDQFFSSRYSRVDGSVSGVRATIIVSLLLLAGCEQEEIHTYTATKAKPLPLAGMRDTLAMQNAGPREPTRMLGAILRKADKTWFFKLTAPPDEAAALREEFGKFVASTQFENGKPSWEIPDDWTQQKESPRSMRFATFTVAPGGPEISIIPLPNQEEETQAAVANINRWRGQLGLSDLESDKYLEALDSDDDAREILPEDEGEIVTITTPAGKAILVDFVGEMATGGGPPFTNMGRRQPGPVEPPVGPPRQANSQGPRLNPPNAWKAARGDAFSMAAFEAGAGDDASRITLSSVGGDLLLNVNRWRRQVGLPPWTAAELGDEKQTLSGEGYTAGYFELIGPTETILGAVITHNGRPWIVKLRGPNSSAANQTDNFKQFVQSIEF